jgi:hypothetical protein
MTGLQSLHCPFRVITFSFAPQCDADLVEFLEHQEQIQDLVLEPRSPNLVLKLTALPKLAKVKAQALWLSMLVHGHPICDVTFNDTSHSAELDVKFLSHSIAPKIGCIHSPLVHVTSAKSPQITPLLDTNEVLGECKT